MKGNELEGLDSFIHALLASDSTLQTTLGGPGRIWQEIAAQGAIEPLVVYSFVSSPDVNVVGNDARAFTRPLFQVRAISRVGFSEAAPIADRFDKLLMGISGQVPSANLSIMGCFREEPLRSVQVDASGITYFYLGGRYRIFVSGITG